MPVCMPDCVVERMAGLAGFVLNIFARRRKGGEYAATGLAHHSFCPDCRFVRTAAFEESEYSNS
ncbi:hypothetical protein DSM101010T_04150 [Desulfovibrio subterraneus]|uniref:Uncharacterized protein n=1 Tax=Desulfovibrio subterraneus TaxID=2718620 RepID=A0A7J0BEA8_9BACT|nr:hypothetical protein DSM101010T_04150 [Desulfovibrio subterraneus]